MKAKKTAKKARTKSAGQIAPAHPGIGSPGIGMFRIMSKIIGGPRGPGSRAGSAAKDLAGSQQSWEHILK